MLKFSRKSTSSFFSLKLLILLNFLSAPLYADYIELTFSSIHNKNGMFDTMDYVVGNLAEYKKIKYNGFFVDFKNRGLYYDPKYGENSWEYYFDPIQLGKKKGRPYAEIENWNVAVEIVKKLSRKQIKEILNQFVHVKDEVMQEITAFEKEYFTDYVIGVHFRGTDKFKTLPFPSTYKDVKKEIDLILEKQPATIFIATDEQAFLDFMLESYPNQVIFHPDVIRSTNGKPLHQNNSSPYLAGYTAIVDCLLLSRCDFLIRTNESCLGRYSTYFNPDLPNKDLSNPKKRS